MDAHEKSSHRGQGNPVFGNSVDMSLGDNAVEKADEGCKEEQKEKDEVLQWLTPSFMDVEEQQVEVKKDSGLANEAGHKEDGHGEEEDRDRSALVGTTQMNPAPGIASEVLSSINDAQIPSLHGNSGTSKAETSLEDTNKRLKSTTDICTFITRIQQDLEPVITEYAAKHQASQESAAKYRIAVRELERGAGTIDELQKLMVEDEQKHQMKVRCLNKELNLTSHLVEGYKRALEATQRSFTEYRARYGQPEEPLYQDVPGSGGLVLSVTEIERRRVKHEEEAAKRLAIEKAFTHFGTGWDRKFADLGKGVEALENKLALLEREMKIVKELYAVSKFLEIV